MVILTDVDIKFLLNTRLVQDEIASLGVLVNLEAVDDCPNPTDEQPAGQDLDSTEDHSGLHGISLRKETSCNCGPARGEDGADQN